MRRTLTTLCLLLSLLALLPATAWAGLCGIKQPCPATGTSITTAATYAALVTAGCTTGGAIGYTEDQDRYWTCNAATGLWLPPHIQPASIDIADYTAAALPPDSAPAWTALGTAGYGAVAGGELTITDNGASYLRYYLTDADISSANNVAIIVRCKVTSMDATAEDWKVYFGMRASALDVAKLSIAEGTALDAANSMIPFEISSTTTTTKSPSNSVYQYYYIAYLKTPNTYESGALGADNVYSVMQSLYNTTNSIANTTVEFGAFFSAGQSTSVWDRVMVFTF